MTGSILAILAVAALLTSIMSAILGMGGGMLLLAVLLSVMSHGEAIPTHAAVQIASNGTRAVAFLGNVDRGAFGRFCIGVVPGGMVGMALLWVLGEPRESEPFLKTLVGGFILVATFLPSGVKPAGEPACWSNRPKRTGSTWRWWDFPVMGFAAGTAALTVGAIGPLIAPLFARRNFVKERLIATKALCQLATHVMKIPAFILLRKLEFGHLGIYAIVMILMVIPGTLLGKRLLKHVPERHFVIAYRVALTAAGLKILIVDGLIPASAQM